MELERGRAAATDDAGQSHFAQAISDEADDIRYRYAWLALAGGVLAPEATRKMRARIRTALDECDAAVQPELEQDA